jgi:2-dehydropantoate 2-reductase
VAVPCVATPDDIDWRPDDAVLLCMKGQHTVAALEALRAAGLRDQPVFCAQNGVANEREALRYFDNVHAINVMLPCEYLEADEAVGFCRPNFGVFDIGRYPAGADDADAALAEALTGAEIVGCVAEDAMVSKYGKLILNLGNVVEAALGFGAEAGDITDALREEARATLRAAGIAWREVGEAEPRRALMRVCAVEGAARIGSSTSQSLARGTGSIETDFLNGEIALIGRLHGAPAPLNAAAARLAARLAREGRAPGALSRAVMLAELGLRAKMTGP